MGAYQKYLTTVVGSHSVPRWYESLERQLEVGAISKADLEEAQLRATQAAILDQEIASITQLGVTIKTKQTLGKDFTIKSLLKDGFQAVFLAVGAHQSQSWALTGRN